MTEQPSLDAIDFSKPDGEFIYKEQIYFVKHYFNTYFFKNTDPQSFEQIYAYQAYGLPETICQPNYFTQLEVDEWIQYYAQRCVQYKNVIFLFGLECGEYYSARYGNWVNFNWKAPRYLNGDDILEKPYGFFAEQAEKAYFNELTIIEDKNNHDAFYGGDNEAPSFMCGSKSELKKLTRLAVYALPEFQSFFENNQSIALTYESENEYYSGGLNWDFEGSRAKLAQKLFDLIFEHNYFTGIYWEYNDGERGYIGYDPFPYTLELEVQAPSQHERIEAALELQIWLQEKLPDDEIRAIFER